MPAPITFDVNPVRYNRLVDLMTAVGKDDNFYATLDILTKAVGVFKEHVFEQYKILAESNQNLAYEEDRATLRSKNPFDEKDDEERERPRVRGDGFLQVIMSIIVRMDQTCENSIRLLSAIDRPTLILSGKRFDPAKFPSTEEMNVIATEIDLNKETISRFVSSMVEISSLKSMVIQLGKDISRGMEHYHRGLVNRHTVEGVKIFVNPIATDVAICVYKNVDGNGEIAEGGKKPTEISAYTLRKGLAVAEGVKRGLTSEFVAYPERFFEFIATNLAGLWDVAEHLSGCCAEYTKGINQILNRQLTTPRNFSAADFDQAMAYIRDLNPNNVQYAEKTGLLSREERLQLEKYNETISEVATRIVSPAYTAREVVDYILERKSQIRKFELEENSFFVCSMGAGNQFLGEAPGMLRVIPGTRPVVDLSEVIGGGFPEIKSFIKQMEGTAKFHDLFKALSPSRTADKSNVLLCGPPGSGKSEVLRAQGGDPKSLGIFAQGSDFLTCWKGEAEKNPKRLFEAAIKLQRESGKHVHILIDEIDSILNNLSAHDSLGGFNLNTEFQILMDGVIQYPSLSVWGATNFVKRLPMAIIRRFARVMVVGELDENHRAELLQHFVSFMPYEGFGKKTWIDLGNRLEGAVGDGIRKVVDHVWREKMSAFVEKHPEIAENLSKSLAPEKGDKFDIGRFTIEQKKTLHGAIKAHVCVTPEDVNDSIDIHMDNVAFISEIETAKEVYKENNEFVLGLKEKRTKR